MAKSLCDRHPGPQGIGALPVLPVEREPLGIYLHLPFCAGKCAYCDFNSRTPGPGEVQRYVRALAREVALRLEPGAAVDTVYLGGGTPTLLAPALLARLLDAVARRVALASDAEITVEGNPESITHAKLAELRAAGFNRLSIGVQSFDDDVLTALGRRHDAAQALAAIAAARATGWDNLSLDLICAVPGQSVEQWRATLRQALDCRPAHISTYCLTIEPGTEFGRRQAAGAMVTVGEEVELEMYLAARRSLRAAGYDPYEISNFALPGRCCRHNRKYWQAGSYIGLGAGAHSHVGGVRWANAPDPQRYTSLLEVGKLPVCYAERLSARRRMDEELILALRTAEGASLARLGARCGRDATSEYRIQIEELAQAGLATADGSRVILTERGIALANEVAIRVMA